MKKSILQIGRTLSKTELRQTNGGFGSCHTAGDCADIYNLYAFEALPDSAFVCFNGSCRFA